MSSSAIGFQTVPARTYASASHRSPAAERVASGRELTPEEQRVVRELEQRDREVRAHERAHKAAAGPHARGGPRYTYQTGPDGRRYAIGGEVSVDTSPEATPEATIRKMQQLQRAANAPAEPSPQDRQVALEARSAEREARTELAEERTEGDADRPGRRVDLYA